MEEAYADLAELEGGHNGTLGRFADFSSFDSVGGFLQWFAATYRREELQHEALGSSRSAQGGVGRSFASGDSLYAPPPGGVEASVASVPLPSTAHEVVRMSSQGIG